ncbi:Gfo/Idh/MocA family oxidoreductase [Blastopirellula sp. J2-11]|uniref:Gfo/Idh/MocA family protein n=1 Tax=Blastopirellula sp. J2-11 TaxID=2943192 RepID=UPI0021C83DCF|nr:Gfo/Idh/MocA family oxidoreductase [Blastopirellula sp. J2-11]UUO09129.1 Gfo/Idh/MocA family oxidoreductase [Blastopirellula sp. J2-11]
MIQKTSRRQFVKQLGLAGAALALPAASYSRVLGANEKLRVASVGTGGKGWSDLLGVAASPAVEVVALCNIDSSADHLGRAAEKYPSARTYADYRKMLDKSDDIDGVIVSTPDFMHAPISLSAMALGKHIFCQKPLTHTVKEARQMQLAAQKHKLVTQMCNQIQSHSAYRTAVALVHAGKIGKVLEVHSWQGGQPSWPRNIDRPAGSDPVPTTVAWDLWQGVAPHRPYKTGIYHPFNWRGWQDYGTGQLGDFGCHILDPVFKSLELTAPLELVADAPPLKPETWTDKATVSYIFPGAERTAGDTIRVTWYDAAGVRPPAEALTSLPKSAELPNAGSILIGEKGTLIIPHVAMPKLYLKGEETEAKYDTVEGVDHYVQWADACRGEDKTTSTFDYSAPLTETVLLGTVAIRFPGQKLKWDAANMTIPGFSQAEPFLTKEYPKGWM